MPTNKRRTNLVGSVACIVFALLAFSFGGYMGLQVKQMEKTGLRTNGVVSNIRTGAKNTKTAIITFSTQDGREVTTKSIFQMFVIRHQTGDSVIVLYDPDTPEIAMIDNGLWNWDQPVFGLGGGVALLALGLLMLRAAVTQKDAE